jgi:carboxyl-terminal processing protease
VKALLRFGGILAGAALFFGVGFSTRDLRAGRLPEPAAFASLAGGRQPFRASAVFSEQFAEIAEKSGRELELDDLRAAAYNGLFASTGDPYTNFLRPDIAEGFALETRGDFVGIGARLSQDPLGARAVVVFKGSPAEAAGLKPMDIITKVDGRTVAGRQVEEIVDGIKGEEGTPVVLDVVREGSEKPLRFRVVRRKVIVPSAEGRWLEKERAGYVAISGFSETTPAQLQQALQDAMPKAGEARGVVLDLRDNPGGLLESAVRMLGLFLHDLPVVVTKGRSLNETYRSPEGSASLVKVAVLVNEESASASEIFAGALQEHKRAKIVGEHTYGKASVQSAFPVFDGALAKITIARYYLPSGANISRKQTEDGEYISGGIKPDIEVELSPEAVIGDPKTDNQLQAAIKALG